MDQPTRRALNAFLLENDDLAALNARLSRLNILQVLGCERVEIRHSNVLAWLLDPGGGHGLGDLFLRRLLARILMENEDLGGALTAARVELMKDISVDVHREWRNCDVLVHDAAGGWCLLIENKVRSGERPGQLRRYEAAVVAEFPGATVIPVLLTLDGADPSEDGAETGWVALSYSEVLDAAERLIQQRRAQIPTDALVLLEHWAAALRRLSMTDPELVDLCRAIYRRHRAAIDLIVEYGTASVVLDACAETVQGIPDLAFDPIVRGKRVWFMPKVMAAAQRPVEPGWGHLPSAYPISWWFDHLRDEQKLQLGLEVGQVSDGAVRMRLMEALKAGGFEFWEKGAFRPDARFTRIWTRKAALPKDADGDVTDDPDAVKAVALRLWEAAGKEETDRLVRALSKFTWTTPEPIRRRPRVAGTGQG